MSEATYYEPHLVGLFTPSLATESEDAEAESLTQKGALNPSTHELPASVKPSFLKSAQWYESNVHIRVDRLRISQGPRMEQAF